MLITIDNCDFMDRQKSLSEYKKLKYIRDQRIKSSKYNNNILLNLVTPLTYEKRLLKVLGEKKNGKNIKNNGRPNKEIFLKNCNRFNTHYSNNFPKNDIKIYIRR